MTRDDYYRWMVLHGNLFGLRDKKDAELFDLWEPILLPFEFDELCAASYAVATDPGTRKGFRENHLQMLRDAVLAKRADAAVRERNRLDRMYAGTDCGDCYGTGFVRVPHPEWVGAEDLERPFFMAVACLCAIGTARFNAINHRVTTTDGGDHLMDLTQYEHTVPHWRTLVAAYQQRRVREFEGVELARTVDRISPIDPAAVKAIIDGRQA